MKQFALLLFGLTLTLGTIGCKKEEPAKPAPAAAETPAAETPAAEAPAN